ncbi:MAG: thiamine pyrophosphate-dependent dehydrogenase E1 component subunit alpha [Chloroflexi bacterium]|nr:MAG: thiamine pyrophosphate-dependent dehydrogenase E1 component subunit alpha [Chloroflexota bacterium]
MATAKETRHAALGLEPDRLLTMYRQMVLARAVDRRMWVLNRQGKAPFVISGQGHEAIQVAAASCMRPGIDWLCPYYRDLPFCLALGMTALEFMLAVFAKADDPNSGARQMPSHFGSDRLRIITSSSVVGTQVVHAVGVAYASKMRGLDEVSVTCIGDGGTSQGDWHESMNWAGIHKLPFICIVQDNDYAISVPHRLQMGVDTVARRAEGYGVAGEAVDGGDLLATLISAKVARFTSHSSDDDQRRYRPQAELEALLRRDPIERFRNYLLDEGVLLEADDERIQQECTAEVDEAVTAAEAAESPRPEDLLKHVYADG